LWGGVGGKSYIRCPATQSVFLRGIGKSSEKKEKGISAVDLKAHPCRQFKKKKGLVSVRKLKSNPFKRSEEGRPKEAR